MDSVRACETGLFSRGAKEGGDRVSFPDEVAWSVCVISTLECQHASIVGGFIPRCYAISKGEKPGNEATSMPQIVDKVKGN